MFLFKLKIYLRILTASWSTFGFNKEFLRFLFIRPVMLLFNSITLFLDNIFFPEYRRIKIEKPIFIIGHPRSGTTFLHRLLTQSQEFAVFEFWQLLFPSLVARKILAPFIMSRIKKGKNTFYYPKSIGHKMTLGSIEEEELLFYHIFNTQFIAIQTSLGLGNKDFMDLVYSDNQPKNVRQKTIQFFKQCLQRQIYYLGKKQILTKMNHSAFRIQSLLEAFPDAKIIYLVRSPYETISSHLSLDRNVLDFQWGLKKIPANRLQRYFERRYHYDVQFYQYIENLISKGIFNPSQFMTLSYDLLKNDLGKAIQTILEFTGLEISQELRKKIQEQIKTQSSYRRKHRNLELKEFGLSKERIARDLSFIFDKYGFKK
ncbi:MAG: sulfotransferase [Desulfobacteraceae bacterium]|nr:sulfotransferase [Desulfobacteraceae bacterium]MBC2718609.1 sulfotransferase [Desulfobacteraceae bacterium]